MAERFLTPKQVAEELSVSDSQLYALIRSGDLPAVKIGGRGQWRIERSKLEEWIERRYVETARFIEEHPFVGTGSAGGGDTDDT
jgi:excisionase family DNA binding protein